MVKFTVKKISLILTCLRYAICFSLIVVFLSIFYFLLSKDFAFSGSLFAGYDFESPSAYILKLVPEGRVLSVVQNEDGTYYQPMIIDPVYFEVKLPRRFDKMTVEFIYENTGQEIVELGIETSEKSENYRRQPLENRKIDNLSYESLKEGNLTLYQRVPKFDKISAFLDETPKNTVLYHVMTDQNFEEMNVKTEINNYDYVLTSYEPPKKEDELVFAKTTFLLDDIEMLNNKIRFQISAPMLDQNKKELKIHQINVNFEGPHFPDHKILKPILELLSKPWKKN